MQQDHHFSCGGLAMYFLIVQDMRRNAHKEPPTEPRSNTLKALAMAQCLLQTPRVILNAPEPVPLVPQPKPMPRETSHILAVPVTNLQYANSSV